MLRSAHSRSAPALAFLRALFVGLALGAPGCGSKDTAVPDGGGGQGTRGAAVRVQDERVRTLREMIADGWLDAAEELFAEVKDLPETWSRKSRCCGRALRACAGMPRRIARRWSRRARWTATMRACGRPRRNWR
ncbi:MAG: hypothetical protein R3F17_04005 [Planctomycetota bacterium]